ncbi:MAG: amino acid ABC transporter permease [Pseudomonadota bacterium]
MTTTTLEHVRTPDRSPPITKVGPIAWLRESFFSSISSTILTLIGIYILYIIIPPIIDWAIFKSIVSGSDRSVCDANPAGACWTFIKVRFNQFMFGLYYAANPDQIWRPVLVFAILVSLIVALLSPSVPRKLYIGAFTLFVFPFLVFALIHGSWLGLPVADTDQWGGLMLTLVLAFAGIVLAFPLGILMALGRQSDLPVIRWMCTLYIELWRAAPLITILFMASVMLPLFLPQGVDIDKVLRAIVGIALFQSAYTAEAIRGGLQALPKGQYEAADALGLGYWKKTLLIILPQALTISIPSIVNTFIALFKDTSLVSIIGLFDLTGTGTAAARSLEWKGFDITAYIFVAFIYWIFCFGMSRYSTNLEKKLDTSHRH